MISVRVGWCVPRKAERVKHHTTTGVIWVYRTALCQQASWVRETCLYQCYIFAGQIRTVKRNEGAA